MYDDGPLSTRQQLDALKLERERAKLLADQAKAQQQIQKVAKEAPVPPVRQGVPTPLGPTPEQLAGEPSKQQASFKATPLGPTPEQLAGEPSKQQASFKATPLGPTQEQLAEVASRQQVVPTDTATFDDSLIGNMIMKESGGQHINPKTGELTTSPKGAKGILQWMPSSAKQPGYGVTPFDVNTADENTQINATRQYITGLTNKYNDLDKALAAYNWGPGNMDKHLASLKEGQDWKVGLPKETANYVDTIKKGYGKTSVPPVVGNEWQVGETIPRPGSDTIEGQTMGKYGATKLVPPPPVDQSIMDAGDAMAMQQSPVANGVPPDFRFKTIDEVAPVVNAPLGNLTASDMAIDASGSPVIDSANIVRPNDTGSMRFDNADNDPRRTDVPPLVAAEIPPGTIMDPRDAMAMQQPTGREVLIAKQDLANSTDKATRERAQSVLNRANDFGVQEQGPMPEVPKKDSRPTINEPVPVPSGIMQSELGNELGDVIPGETRQRKLTTEEAVSAVDKRISKLDPNNPLDLRTIQELEKQKETLSEEAVARGEEPPKPEVKPEDLPDIQRNKFDQLGELGSKVEAETLTASLMDTEFPGYTANAMQIEKLMLEGKDKEAASKINPSFWSKLSESFGDLFTDKEFIKFGILLAGGLLSGGSFGGSLKYAGLYALQSADKREEAKRKSELELGKENIKAGATAKTARIKALSDEVKAGIQSGRFPLQTGDRILKVLNGPDGVLKAEALLSQEGIESPVYRAGLDPSKQLQVMVEGKLAPVTAYENPNTGGYSYVESEVDGNGIQKSFLINLPKNKATVTDKNFDQNQTAAFNELSDKLLSTGVIVRDKNNKPINIDQAVNKDMLIGQLREWSGKQRELGLNDDPRVYIDTINIALRKAVESGDKNPHMGKLLDLAILNSASIIDEDKLTGANSGYIGKAVEDIKSFSSKFKNEEEKEKFIKSLTGSKSSKDKKVAGELQRRSSKFFDDVSNAYGDGKDALDQDDLAEKLKENAGKNMNRTLYDKVKEAPNKWWAYVYYQIGLEEAKQKKAK